MFTTRAGQQGHLLHAAIFSGVSTSSQSSRTKRSAKDILRKPKHSCLSPRQEAKLLCKEHGGDEGSLVVTASGRSCSAPREPTPASPSSSSPWPAVPCPRASAQKAGFVPEALLSGQFPRRVRPAVHAAVAAAGSIRHSPGTSPQCSSSSASPFFSPCTRGIALTNTG